MPLNISKECFPAPTVCYNCARKSSSHVKGNCKEYKLGGCAEAKSSRDYKRCGGCHLFTYCDQDCQREHWIRVHKNHCKFLSGKVLVKNSKHSAATCSQCIEERQTCPNLIRNENSARTACNTEDIITIMKKMIGQAFRFHGEGKKCDCRLEFALNLPFALGEVSGKYLQIASTGIDTMLAHTLKIVNTMFIKSNNDEHKNLLIKLYTYILKERSFLWIDILFYGKPVFRSEITNLSDQVDNLQTFHGASNPWLKTLKFSVEFIVNTLRYFVSNSIDFHNLKDTRFQHFKQLHGYQQSQLQNQAVVCEKQMWPNFLLWPQLFNGSLAIILPPGARCQSCKIELRGEVALSPQESNSKTLPFLLPDVGENGALMTSCPSPSCVVNCQSKNVAIQMLSNEDQWKDFLKEDDLFFINSRECDFCQTKSLSSHRCSACLSVQYCSTVCQKEDLDFHQPICEIWAKDESRKIVDRGKQRDHWKSALGKK